MIGLVTADHTSKTHSVKGDSGKNSQISCKEPYLVINRLLQILWVCSFGYFVQCDFIPQSIGQVQVNEREHTIVKEFTGKPLTALCSNIHQDIF